MKQKLIAIADALVIGAATMVAIPISLGIFVILLLPERKHHEKAHRTDRIHSSRWHSTGYSRDMGGSSRMPRV